jgi:hypothetical protein
VTTTTANARDEMLTIVSVTMAAAFPTAEVRYDGKPVPTPPPADGVWVRASLRHAEGRQGSLSCEHGERRWRRLGTLAVQCFAPLSGPKPLQTAEAVACAIRDAFQGAATPGGVWFREATTNEVGPDASWYQVNATVLFEYDEVR